VPRSVYFRLYTRPRNLCADNDKLLFASLTRATLLVNSVTEAVLRFCDVLYEVSCL